MAFVILDELLCEVRVDVLPVVQEHLAGRVLLSQLADDHLLGDGAVCGIDRIEIGPGGQVVVYLSRVLDGFTETSDEEAVLSVSICDSVPYFLSQLFSDNFSEGAFGPFTDQP